MRAGSRFTPFRARSFPTAFPLLFETMKARGFTVCAVQIAPDNAASLALHRKLGFVQTGRNAQAVTMEKAL